MTEQASKNGRAVLAQTIPVDVPGFEGVEVTFNLMVSEAAADEFIKRMGGPGLDGKPTHEGVILEVKNWPAADYGPDPFDRGRSPSVFRAWVARKGWGLAMAAYIQAPN